MILTFLFSDNAAIFGSSRPEACLAIAHDLFEGEEDGRLWGDGDRKIKRASGGNTRTSYTWVLLSFPPATRCHRGRPPRSCPPSHSSLPSFPTAGPKSKKHTSGLTVLTLAPSITGKRRVAESTCLESCFFTFPQARLRGPMLLSHCNPSISAVAGH